MHGHTQAARDCMMTKTCSKSAANRAVRRTFPWSGHGASTSRYSALDGLIVAFRLAGSYANL